MRMIQVHSVEYGTQDADLQPVIIFLDQVESIELEFRDRNVPNVVGLVKIRMASGKTYDITEKTGELQEMTDFAVKMDALLQQGIIHGDKL